ncbi:pyridoxamine 5'-phosphate oxidase family protein [Halorubrum rubrum]|uniref:Pyridoxamine 5'-phosphate oxidase family protein n=1 Tax=Halorubrum rubrum TaxID=1126240 RepID=A0ABD5R3B3_9EURY|nr:pyridoxamine 5'-phosphate oxidase family protein [Halorubrum rubrum]
MDHVEYVYTGGMTESDVDDHLRAGEHGVLGLANGNDAYAIPLSYHYDGDRLLLRVSAHDDDGEKGRFLETTDRATFVCYDASTSESWSIHVRGPIREWEGDADEATLNDWFQPFRLFDETVENVEFALYELRMETVVGRETIE